MARDNGTDPIMIALDSFSIGNSVVIQGNLYRSSDSVVKQRPEAFIGWLDSTTGEREAAHRELMAAERQRVGLP